MEKETATQTIKEEKKSYHHHFSYQNSYQNSYHFGNQMTLDGKTIVKPNISKHFLKLLEAFYHNPTKITQGLLKKVFVGQISEPTITRFMKWAEDMGYIKQLKIIKGKVEVNNAYCFVESRDKYSDGSAVIDKRTKYFIMTDLGMRVYESNVK
jgi:hypothetical protein